MVPVVRQMILFPSSTHSACIWCNLLGSTASAGTAIFVVHSRNNSVTNQMPYTTLHLQSWHTTTTG